MKRKQIAVWALSLAVIFSLGMRQPVAAAQLSMQGFVCSLWPNPFGEPTCEQPFPPDELCGVCTYSCNEEEPDEGPWCYSGNIEDHCIIGEEGCEQEFDPEEDCPLGDFIPQNECQIPPAA